MISALNFERKKEYPKGMRINEIFKTTQPTLSPLNWASEINEFWNSDCASIEAGEEKLISGLEWRIYHKNTKKAGVHKRILNVGKKYPNNFFGDEAAASIDYIASFHAIVLFNQNKLEFYDEIFANVFDDFILDEFLLESCFKLLKPSGKLFLGLFSSDHFDLAEQYYTTRKNREKKELILNPPVSFSINLISNLIPKSNFTLKNIIPYSTFFGNSIWKAFISNQYRWERILEWFSTDQELFELALFLEEEFGRELGFGFSPRSFFLLEKSLKNTPDLLINKKLENELLMLNLNKATRIKSVKDSEQILDLASSVFQHKGKSIQNYLNTSLVKIRNRVFLIHLWKILNVKLNAEAINNWMFLIPEFFLQTYSKWDEQQEIDLRCMALVRNWYAVPELEAQLKFFNVPLGPGLEYEQVRNSFVKVFNLFPSS